MSREAFHPVFREMLEANDLYVYESGGKIASTYRITCKLHRISHIAYFGSFAMHPDFKGHDKKSLTQKFFHEHGLSRAEKARQLRLTINAVSHMVR